MSIEERIFKKLDEETVAEDKPLLECLKVKIPTLSEKDKKRIEEEIDKHILVGGWYINGYLKYLVTRDFKENQRSL